MEEERSDLAVRTEGSSRRMPRGKFQQLSLEMVAVSTASLLNLDSKRSAQASAETSF